jgi:hypothetical protein
MLEIARKRSEVENGISKCAEPEKVFPRALSTTTCSNEQHHAESSVTLLLEQFRNLQIQAHSGEEGTASSDPDHPRLASHKLPEPAAEPTLNGWDLACQPWPKMEFTGNIGSSTSRSVCRIELEDVRLISNFVKNLESFIDGTGRRELENKVSVKSKMLQSELDAKNEPQIQDKLTDNVYPTMNELLGDVAYMTRSICGLRLKVYCKADGYCATSDPTHPIVAALEAKKPSLTARGDCLVRQYKDHNAGVPNSRLDSEDACQQVGGYLTLLRTPYGFITTYEYIWCVFLGADRVLHVSPGFATNISGKRSAFNVMYYWIRKALADDRRQWQLPVWIAVSSSKEQKDGLRPDQRDKENKSQQKPKEGPAAHCAGGAGGKQRPLAAYNRDPSDPSCPAGLLCCSAAASSQFLRPLPEGWPFPACDVCAAVAAATGAALAAARLRLFEVLVEQKERITWRAVHADGAPAVVKAYVSAAARDLEMECYDALRPLQGRSVPRVLQRSLLISPPGPRYYYTDSDYPHDPRIHAFALSWVGPEPAEQARDDPQRAPDEGTLERVRRVLRRMHGLGVAHGDVHPGNMAVDPGSGRVAVFDFSHAATLASLGGNRAAFSRACAEDMRALEEHLAAAKEAKAKAKAAERAAAATLLAFR